MSITFTTDLEPELTPPTACLCTQMAPRFCEAVNIEGREEPLPLDLVAHLAEHAAPTCHCKGRGVEAGMPVRSSFVNLCQPNGFAVAALLGFPRQEWGACSIEHARTALARALGADLRRFERVGELVVSAAPVVAEALGAAILEGTVLEGVAKLEPPASPDLRRWAREFTSDDMRERLVRLLAFVDAQRAQGATELRWS